MTERLPVNKTELLQLARSGGAANHDRLLLGLAELCALQPFGQGESGAMAADVLLTLARRAELRIRAQLAERLADTPWAPHELIVLLAHDDIEVADPILAGSPVLTEDDLVAVCDRLSEAHRRAVARRPGLAAPVCEAIASRREPRVLPVLLENPSAEMTEAALADCVEAARRHRPLWGPLVWRKDLPIELAAVAYQLVGDALRSEIRRRYADSPDSLDAAIQDAARSAAESEAEEDRALRPMAARLVEKLEASGRLTPGFAVKCVNEGKLDLFEHAIARLADASPLAVQAAIERRHSRALALSCRAAGVDRSIFPSVHAAYLKRGRIDEPLEGAALAGCAEAFRDLTPEAAAAALRRMGANA